MLSSEENKILEEYYRQEYESMLKFARYSLHNENLAEVAVQETFLIASKRFKKFVKSPNSVGWLFNTLKNVIHQLKRERQKALERYVSLDSVQEPSAEMPPISSLPISKNADLQLIAQLYVDEYSLEQIAEKLV